MYKSKNTNLLIPVFLLLSIQATNLGAFSFRDTFSDMFEDMDHAFKNMKQGFKSRFHTQDKLSTEDQELVNKQLEIVAKIKPEITKNESGLVSIAFPIDNINKEKIELSIEHGLLNGIIPLENGYFRFIVYPKFIKCEYLIELTKEVTYESPKTEEVTTDKEINNEKEKSSYSQTMAWRTSNYFTEALPLEVDLSKAQSETKNNKLFIRLEPKSYTRLKIRHA